MYKPEHGHLTSGIHDDLGLCGKLIPLVLSGAQVSTYSVN